MRKNILLGIFALIACFVVALIYYNNYYYIDVSANELSQAYQTDRAEAIKEYTNKKVEVDGTVKAFYKLMGIRNILELKTNNSEMPVLCFFIRQQDEYTASRLHQNEKVVIKGICVGTEEYSYVKGVKIEVHEIMN